MISFCYKRVFSFYKARKFLFYMISIAMFLLMFQYFPSFYMTAQFLVRIQTYYFAAPSVKTFPRTAS